MRPRRSSFSRRLRHSTLLNLYVAVISAGVQPFSTHAATSSSPGSAVISFSCASVSVRIPGAEYGLFAQAAEAAFAANRDY